MSPRFVSSTTRVFAPGAAAGLLAAVAEPAAGGFWSFLHPPAAVVKRSASDRVVKRMVTSVRERVARVGLSVKWEGKAVVPTHGPPRLRAVLRLNSQYVWNSSIAPAPVTALRCLDVSPPGSRRFAESAGAARA